MVRLSMTKSMVSAIEFCSANNVEGWPAELLGGEPSLQNPSLGQPITHSQVIALSRCLREHFRAPAAGNNANKSYGIVYDLDGLLRGSKVYNDPPKPKREPTPEFKALMARLREQEEAMAYERMINPPPQLETFNQRFPAASEAHLFPAGAINKEVEDEISYADVNRQVTLIINVLVSIVACSVAIWMAASHWSTPQRLGLSMGGSGVVGIAEVVVYAGYLRRVKEAKEKEKKKPEIKEIIGTWVISSEKPVPEVEAKLIESPKPDAVSLRKRTSNRGG